MESSAVGLRVRRVARVILLNEFGEVLLINHFHTFTIDPKKPDIFSFWIPPGGGLEEGETYEACAIRELTEETGIAINSVERCIFTREAELMYDGELVAQQDRFFLSRVSGRPSFSLQTTNEGIVDARWWPIHEIEYSTDSFIPSGLAALMKAELERA